MEISVLFVVCHISSLIRNQMLEHGDFNLAAYKFFCYDRPSNASVIPSEGKTFCEVITFHYILVLLLFMSFVFSFDM